MANNLEVSRANTSFSCR